EIFIDQSGVGTHEVYFSSSNGEFSVTVIDILPIEIVDFTLPSSFETCEGSGDTVQPSLEGGFSNGTWNISGGGVIDPSTGTIDVEASGAGSFTVTFMPSGPCAYPTSQDIDLTIGASSPNIDVFCSTTIDAVYFNWSPIEGAENYEISYSINGSSPIFSTISGTDFEVNGLFPGDFVTITVEAIGNSICSDNTIGSSTCDVADCPPVFITIHNLNPIYCSDMASFELTATPAGGTFFGNGVENSTFFNPAATGIGIHTIQYEYTDFNTGCSYSENASIEVLAPIEAVTITCGDVASDMVSFNWNEVLGYDFEVTYTVNGENPITTTTNDNSFVVTDLNPEDAVELSVVVLNDNACGNSPSSTLICTAQACDPIVLSIDNLAAMYCSNEEVVTLAANVDGGIFYVNGNESTIFEPAILGEGSHLVNYILEQNGCMFDVQTTVEVVEPLEAVLVECGEITDNSLTFNWNESANATEYQIVLSGAITDNFSQTATTFTIENLTAADAVTIEVTAMGAIDCANSEPAIVTCSIPPLVQECLTPTELNQSLSFPNAFSPNQDGVNDSFRPVFPYAFLDYELMIFNRWGKEVFGSRDVDAAWKGVSVNTFEEAALGVYVWHLKATVVNDCGEEMVVDRKGNVTLVR
ncbi:MAG: gliding motility-associated C-terminal domain-containing protein, partial [Chitinophagales bacterium]